MIDEIAPNAKVPYNELSLPSEDGSRQSIQHPEPNQHQNYINVPISNQLISTQNFPNVSIPAEIKQLSEEELRNIQQRETENFEKRNDCCFDKIFLCIIAEIGMLTFVILGLVLDPSFHYGTIPFGILYLIDFFISNTFRFFCMKKSSLQALNYIENLKKEMPHIAWTIQNYHYETRTRYVVDGNHGHIETHRVRVNTHFARHEVIIASTVDSTNYSDIINHLTMIQFCRLYFAKNYSFNNVQSQNNFNILKQYFITSNKRDDHIDFKEDYVIHGFKSKMCAYSEIKGGCLYSIPSYILLTLLGFGWLLRVIFYKNSFCGNIKINKVISVF